MYILCFTIFLIIWLTISCVISNFSKVVFKKANFLLDDKLKGSQLEISSILVLLFWIFESLFFKGILIFLLCLFFKGKDWLHRCKSYLHRIKMYHSWKETRYHLSTCWYFHNLSKDRCFWSLLVVDKLIWFCSLTQAWTILRSKTSSRSYENLYWISLIIQVEFTAYILRRHQIH